MTSSYSVQISNSHKMNVINNPHNIFVPSARGKIQPSSYGITDGVFRLPTDPVFFADFTLTNILVWSTYWIAESANLSNVLASGTAWSSTVVITGMASYSSPTMLVTIRIRKIWYSDFPTQAFHSKTWAGSYIIQVIDPTQ